MKEKVIRKYLAITKKLDDMVEEIRAEKGYKSFTAVIESAIIDFHGSVFKDYVMARKMQAAKTPEEKADTQLRVQEIKKQREEDVLMDIAKQLEGRVSGPAGDKRVKYFTYDKSNRYEQDVPLEMLTSELIEGQYFPDKETVLQRQVEGKVNYDPKSKE